MPEKQKKPEQKKCRALKPDGTACNRKSGDDDYCPYHRPKPIRPVQGGRYSKYVENLDIASLYEEAYQDKDLFQMREEVSLISARIAQILRGMGTGETKRAWERAKKALEAYESTDDFQLKHDAIEEMRKAISEGDREQQAWQELLEYAEAKRRMTETQTKMAIAAGLYITAEQAAALMGAIQHLITKHIQDPEKLNAIKEELVLISSGRLSDIT